MTVYRPMQSIHTEEEFVSILDELSHCLKTLTTPMALDFRQRLRAFIHDRGLDHDPNAFAELPIRQYAYIELFGHTCLGACLVREVERFGVKMCEARPLGLDGEPGAARRFPGTAIYCERELTEEEAKRLAMPRMLPVPVPPCATCGYGVCDCSAAERDGQFGNLTDEQSAREEKAANRDLDAAGVPDDGTPLCEPIEEGEDDIPF